MSTWLVCAHTYVDTHDSDLSPAEHLAIVNQAAVFPGPSLVGLCFRSVGAALFPRGLLSPHPLAGHCPRHCMLARPLAVPFPLQQCWGVWQRTGLLSLSGNSLCWQVAALLSRELPALASRGRLCRPVTSLCICQYVSKIAKGLTLRPTETTPNRPTSAVCKLGVIS